MKLNKKSLVLLVCVTLLLTFAVSGTVAFLADNSGPVVNQFTPASVPPTVDEKTDDGVKSDVKIKNSGTVSAYIRATYVITLQSSDGTSILPAVSGKHYTLTMNSDSGWLRGNDGFFYWKDPVLSGNQTGILMKKCEVIQAAIPDGYSLHVEILAQSIQADGVDPTTQKKPVELAWGVTVTGTTITTVP